jgi:hypothetical protein
MYLKGAGKLNLEITNARQIPSDKRYWIEHNKNDPQDTIIAIDFKS